MSQPAETDTTPAIGTEDGTPVDLHADGDLVVVRHIGRDRIVLNLDAARDLRAWLTAVIDEADTDADVVELHPHP